MEGSQPTRGAENTCYETIRIIAAKVTLLQQCQKMMDESLEMARVKRLVPKHFVPSGI